MFNVGGGEVLVILVVALLVIGPSKLPEAARQIGAVLSQIRKVSTGFQNELKTALDEADKPSPPAATTAAARPIEETVTEPDEDGDDEPAEDEADAPAPPSDP
ncbi:MAG: Sec-independent protein translocase protein TatB [Actinomycetota bacterium]